MTIEPKLIHALLDKYERSRGFVERRSQRNRIQLKMYEGGKTDFSDYDIEDSAARTAINEAAIRLAKQGVIDLEWMRGQEGHILHRILLRSEALAQAYQYCGRKPLANLADELEAAMTQVQRRLSAGWAQRYLADQVAFLHRKRHPDKSFSGTNEQQREWLTVLEALGTLSPAHPVLERVFSLRCLGNSKAFEQHYRTRLLGVLREYLLINTEEMTDEELLRQAGLERYPEWFSLCGPVEFRWPDGRVLDAAPLLDGLQISAADAPNAQICFAPPVRTLLFIENKANYYDTIHKHPSPERVVVFHGGCYSPQRGQFFRQLCRAAGPQMQLLHWGDIDCGGFEMDSRLRQEIDARIRPWRMDAEQLSEHRDKAESFSDAYAAKLEPLLQDPYLQDSREAIRYMLRHRLRLEQEALIED